MSIEADSIFTSGSLGEAVGFYFRKTPVDVWSYTDFLNCMKPLILLYNIINRPAVWRNKYINALKKIASVNKDKDDPISRLKKRIAILLANQKLTPDVVKFWRQINGQTRVQKINAPIDALEVLEAAEKPHAQGSRELPHHDTVAALEEHDGGDDEVDDFDNKDGCNNVSNEENADSRFCCPFVERVESQPVVTHQRSWILRSGTNVGDVLAEYVKTIPEAQKYLCLAYWNILDLTNDNNPIKSFFPSDDDWKELMENFETDVRLVESDVPPAVYYFFDEVEKITKSQGDILIINAIDQVSAEFIENKNKIKLSNEEKDVIAAIRRAVVTYAENLAEVDLPVSEAAFDNAFPNMLRKRFLNKSELKMDVGEIACWASAQRRNEGRSVVLRARVGQKCDFRGTLKNSANNLEAAIGLRSGGLPEAHRKKIFQDRIDLAVTMRDVLYTFYKANCHAPENDLHRTYVLGMQSWGWDHEVYAMDCKATNVLRLGKVSHTKMPNTLKTLALLESFYVSMSNTRATLTKICDHANDVALAHSRAHRHLKRKAPEQKRSFGGLLETPPKKGRRERDDD
ncbi:hypothetical protein G9A89_023312 [Geosiphon pyriformis]|nr:hypothetical protein G9A89_023312 [Geosiphon pyriformis]